MRTLILSDIHANEPALKAVFQDAGPCDRVVFLGDLANFGPHPSQCVDLLQKYNPICIIGNHDKQIISGKPQKNWDKWSRNQLTDSQLAWMATFKDCFILDGHILLIHGAYSVDYDILPNISDADIVTAFKNVLSPPIDQVWFGHYHYQIDRTIDGVGYHCIRPVGQHRDKDTRASYSVYENGILTHKRTEYNLSKTISDFESMDLFKDSAKKAMFSDFLRNAYHEQLLEKDIRQMAINDAKAE